MQYFSVQQMNDAARNPSEFIKKSDAQYDLMVYNAAQAVLRDSRERPIVLLSGPSGSGKTTTAIRIENLLASWGHVTHTLSMDNYYFRAADGSMPLDDEGNIDLESPDLIDVDLLRRHLQMMIDGQEVEVPTFDFAGQRRSEVTTPMRRRPGELIVVEGIHALNPEVVGDAHGWATGIYVSVRTRVKEQNGFVLHPSKVRLLRRLMRDRRGRGQSYEDTISRMRSVNRGERLYIMPNKHHADINLDTFCPYELPVYREILLEGLARVDQTFLEDCDVSDTVPFLKMLTGMGEEGIGREALIREFIGGGLV